MKTRSRLRLVACLLLFAALPAGRALAKTYSADRFDVRARLHENRSLDVEETVVFRMEDGTFTYVWRDIPVRRTDGIVDLVARMDGVVLPEGTGEGHVEVRRGGSVRVTWHFAPTSGVHRFSLAYRMLGVAAREGGGDTLAWVMLPQEHGYAIAQATASIELPDGARLIAPVMVRPSAAGVSVAGSRILVSAAALNKDASVRIDARIAPGTLSASLPSWQAADEIRRRRGPWMLLVAAGILVAGLGWLATFVAAWSRPTTIARPRSASRGGPPDEHLPVAIAARLGSRGGTMAQAMATLTDLAARGVVRIEERPRATKFFGRSFALQLVQEPAGLLPHEAMLLDLAFGSGANRKAEVTLQQLQRLLANKGRRFSAAIVEAMRRRGLIDADRQAARRTLIGAAIGIACLGVVAIAFAVGLARTFGGWSAVVPAAVGVVALATAIAASTFDVLTREGRQQAADWRAWLTALATAAKDKTSMSPTAVEWLPFAVAAGAAHAWAKKAAASGASVPSWFRAAATADDGAAFVALMAAEGSSSGVNAGASAGGAAGGGSSGAG